MRTTTKTCQTCFTGFSFNVFVRESGRRLHETIVRLLAVGFSSAQLETTASRVKYVYFGFKSNEMVCRIH
jgi:hypothetical protein